MSVDLSVIDQGCCDAHHHQFTYNYTPALREAGFPSWKMLDNLPAHTVGVFVGRVLLELQTRPDHFGALIKGGGEWGTVTTLVEQLAHLVADCDRHPDARVRVG